MDFIMRKDSDFSNVRMCKYADVQMNQEGINDQSIAFIIYPSAYLHIRTSAHSLLNIFSHLAKKSFFRFVA